MEGIPAPDGGQENADNGNNDDDDAFAGLSPEYSTNPPKSVYDLAGGETPPPAEWEEKLENNDQGEKKGEEPISESGTEPPGVPPPKSAGMSQGGTVKDEISFIAKKSGRQARRGGHDPKYKDTNLTRGRI